jgi:hypothetical protein
VSILPNFLGLYLVEVETKLEKTNETEEENETTRSTIIIFLVATITNINWALLFKVNIHQFKFVFPLY